MDPIILKKVMTTVLRYRMFEKDDRVVVAVSGGPDSVCLLYVLHKLRKTLGIDLIVCHFDHGLRPGEDKQETLFVQMLAESLGLPFATERATKELRLRGSLHGGSGPRPEIRLPYRQDASFFRTEDCRWPYP